jgi:phosphate transport system substrate-binding protein
MIPRFFRCGDPTKICPLAVSREIIKDQPSFACPCKNEGCSLHREDVGLVDGLTNGRSKLVYAGVAVLAFALLLALILGGGNQAEKALAELKARLAPLESELQQLESKSKGTGSMESPTTDPKPLQATTIALEKQATDAIGSKDPMQVVGVQKRITTQLATVRGVLESLDRPKEGSGVIAADAKSLVTKLTRLDEDAELRLEPVITNSPQSAEVCEDFLTEISDCQARARRLASPEEPGVPGPESKAIRQSLSQILALLEATQQKLDKFAPPPPLPFQQNEADLVIAASGSLAGDLIAPLAAAWSRSEVIPAEDGNFYITGSNGRRILVKPAAGNSGFKMLADGDCAVFFADRSPSVTDLASFGSDFRESRSVAEVVAMDALTLLVHSDNPTSTVTVGSKIPFRIAAGPENSAIREKAAQFGFPVTGAGEASGEDAALADRNLLSLGLYHEEGVNLRAKRLAVRATEETLALKPSPFTIATEDYLYSFRIVAWTAPKAVAEALQLVKFTTSNDGQEVVAKQGFIDLRLTGSQGDVPPEILAALGAAIGSDTISSSIRLSTNFRFETGKSLLDLKAQADLERLPRFVFEKYPTHKMVILGFTDSDGGPDINMPLSKDRAEVVSTELRRSKVDARSAGLGPVFPVDTNATEAGKAKNRRAEVWAVRP